MLDPVHNCFLRMNANKQERASKIIIKKNAGQALLYFGIYKKMEQFLQRILNVFLFHRLWCRISSRQKRIVNNRWQEKNYRHLGRMLANLKGGPMTVGWDLPLQRRCPSSIFEAWKSCSFCLLWKLSAERAPKRCLASAGHLNPASNRSYAWRSNQSRSRCRNSQSC